MDESSLVWRRLFRLGLRRAGVRVRAPSETAQIESLGSALFWTTTQLLTVSFNIQNPISFPRRVLDVMMEIYAITVVGSLAGAFGAFLIKRGEELDEAAEST